MNGEVYGTVKTVPQNYIKIDGRARRPAPTTGHRGYGCAITPLSLRDISPNRGISPTPTRCHSEPIGEESRVVYFCFVLLEILRFAQDDK